MVIGEREGYVNFFPGIGVGLLDTGIRLEDENGVIDVGENSSPELVDWDNDGDLDLLIGEDRSENDRNGYIEYYRNDGTPNKHKFVFAGTLTFINGKDKDGNDKIQGIRYTRVQIQISDMNSDGLFDLLVGYNAGFIKYYENIGVIGEPIFTKPVNLQLTSGEDINAYSDIHFCVGDWNGDDIDDILYSGYADDETGKNPMHLLLGDFSSVTSLTKHTGSIFMTPSISVNNNNLVIKNIDINFSSVEIFSLQGKLLFEKKINEYSDLIFAFHPLGSGLFFAKLLNNAESVTVPFLLK